MAIYNAFTIDGETVKGTPKQAATFIFTDKGHIEQGAVYNADGSLSMKITSEIEDGYATKRTVESEDGDTMEITYTYDKSHHPVNCKVEQSDGGYSYEETNTWKDGKIVKCVIESSTTSGDFKYTNLIEYDDDGSYVVEQTDDDGKTSAILKFDENHNITYQDFGNGFPAKVAYNAKGVPELTQNGSIDANSVSGFYLCSFGEETEITYEYEYDSHDTWTKRTRYNDDNEPDEIITREIEY